MALGAAAALAPGLNKIALAAGYPDRLVRVYLPVAAGTGLDVDGRGLRPGVKDGVRLRENQDAGLSATRELMRE